MKKHSFILLEVLIALFLITACIIPLIRIPYIALKKEISFLENFHLTRIADLSFSEIKTKLFKNEIHWSDIPLKTDSKNELIYELPPYNIFCFKTKKTINRKAIICAKEKEGKQNITYRLAIVTIVLSKDNNEKKEFVYKAFMRKLK